MRLMTEATPLLDVSAADLDDLRARLRNTRWATPWPLPAWAGGTDGDELRRLVTYWADGYDWRAHESAINALPSAFADIDGTRVHYLRFDGERAGALPIILANGWPSTFLELTELAQRLATPSQYGANSQEAFTVIVPSLPGFTFSQPRANLSQAQPTHELWHRLMHDELGFDRYGAHAGDLGSGITGWLAQAHPEAVVGLHLTDVDRTPLDDGTELSAEEREFLDTTARWSVEKGAFAHQQRTRPLTLAQGLSDSPAGLLAWMLEKYRDWSDCDGELSTRFSDDFILTQASLYWFTNTISTSFRDYYERGHGFAPRLERVDVPTAVTVFPADIIGPPPRSWIERRYNLTRYRQMPRGGHFAPHEEPALLAEAITTFFQTLAGR
jgi:pimeloyl-ACP methyl ester carboxylesterase